MKYFGLVVGTILASINGYHSGIPKHEQLLFNDGASSRIKSQLQGCSFIETVSWAIKIEPQNPFNRLIYNMDVVAQDVAHRLGLQNEGQIGALKDHYLFSHPLHKIIIDDMQSESFIHVNSRTGYNVSETIKYHDIENYQVPSLDLFHYYLSEKHKMSPQHWQQMIESVTSQLNSHVNVQWHNQQIVRSRKKRRISFSDPAFPKQWHLVNHINAGYDINVTGIWELGITGEGVTAVVVDDGLEWHNPDIKDNYSPEGSYDFNSHDTNPMPDLTKAKNHHGTRCAGEIAAVKNSVCGVGVAYGAKIAGLRILDGPMTDATEAEAFTKNLHVNQVFSCSWGPDDDGKTVDGPRYLATQGLRHGVDYGRDGYGAVYVVASGNGGAHGDNCNYDGYANSVYTLTIGAVDEWNEMPYYAEECASMLAVTYSSGDLRKRSIVTTDWTYQGGSGCTDYHTGTSAAAPIAAGIVALMLQARPCLSWRDVQYIVIMAAVKVDVSVADWHRNAAGLHHSHKHGFGLMDAWTLVNAAKIWESVPWPTTFTSEVQVIDAPIIVRPKKLELYYEVDEDKLDGYELLTLEYIQVTVTLTHARRGDVEIRLTCPSHTESVMAAARPNDDSVEGFTDWTFSTVRCWGEKPEGTYKLTVTDKGKVAASRGIFVSWVLKLYGTPMTFEDIQDRIKKVRDSADGIALTKNISLPCPPPPIRPPPYTPVSQRILKVLLLSGAFCIFLAVYETFEYIFCYDDEKRLHKRMTQLAQRAMELASGGARSTTEDIHDSLEVARLLNSETGDVVQMTDLSTEDDNITSSTQNKPTNDYVSCGERQRLVQTCDKDSSADTACQRLAQSFSAGISEQLDHKSVNEDEEISN